MSIRLHFRYVRPLQVFEPPSASQLCETREPISTKRGCPEHSAGLFRCYLHKVTSRSLFGKHDWQRLAVHEHFRVRRRRKLEMNGLMMHCANAESAPHQQRKTGAAKTSNQVIIESCMTIEGIGNALSGLVGSVTCAVFWQRDAVALCSPSSCCARASRLNIMLRFLSRTLRIAIWIPATAEPSSLDSYFRFECREDLFQSQLLMHPIGVLRHCSRCR